MSSDPSTPPAPAPARTWREVLTPYVPYLARIALLLLAAAVGAIGHKYNADPVVIEKWQERIREIPVPVRDGAESVPVSTDGWSPDAEAADRDAAQSAFKSFADTPAGQVAAAELPKQVFGWKAIEKLTGRPTPLKDQNPTGSCVGFGTTTGVEHTLATEILARGGDASEFTFFSEEVTYAGSKVQGAKALGARPDSRDGSAGVFVKAWFGQAGGGMVPKGKYGAIDLTTYDPARARSWNVSGPPAALLAVAAKYPVKSAAKVTNWQQSKRAMASGYFPAICASWSYARVRDANGIAAPTHEGWNHCMALTGYIVLPDGREFGHIENSWTNLPDSRGNRTGQAYHTGPTGWGNPTTAGFWASADSIDAALRQGDSFAYSGVTGFPAKKLPVDWFVDVKPARPAAREPALALAW